MSRVSESERARTMGISPQYLWQLRRAKRGLCGRCGARPIETGYKTPMCAECREAHRNIVRKSNGWSAKAKGAK